MADQDAPPKARPILYAWGLVGVPVLSGVVGMALAENDCDDNSGDCDMTALAFPFFAIGAFVLAAVVLVVGEVVLWFGRRFPRHR